MKEWIAPLGAPQALDANRFGPKAANLARLAHAGLPVPGGPGSGFCIDAQAYRRHLQDAGLEPYLAQVQSPEPAQARRAALALKLGLLEARFAPAWQGTLLASWREMRAKCPGPFVVRSSALVEDRFGTSFAGQFESYLGLDDEDELCTAIRSCWAALWATRVLRYMATNGASPSETAMAVLVQPLVQARASGGALSRTADGNMLVTSTPGLGAALAQGEAVPDRYVLSRDGARLESSAARTTHKMRCMHGAQRNPRPLPADPSLSGEQAMVLGGLVRRVEDLLGMPVEIEWAMDEAGFYLLQARPLLLQASQAPDEIWLRHPGLNGHPAGVGWGSGRACVVQCECELARVAPGDVLVTRVAGPSLSQVLARVAGVVAELGGSTSHLASLARERGVPAVFGVAEATQRIPDGAQVAVDGVAGVVRWMR